MNDKTKPDLLILSTAALLLLLGTVGVILRFGQTGKQTEQPESKRLSEWRVQLNIFVNQSRWAEAEIVAKRILKVHPDDLEMLRMAGKVYYKNGNYKEARRQLNRVLLMEPANTVDRCNYALALTGMGLNGQALSELRRAYRDSGGASFIYQLFREIALKSNYSGDSLENIEVNYAEAPAELFEIPPQKGKKK